MESLNTGGKTINEILNEIQKLESRIASIKKELKASNKKRFIFTSSEKNDERMSKEERKFLEKQLQSKTEELEEFQKKKEEISHFDTNAFIEFMSFVISTITSKDVIVVFEKNHCNIKSASDGRVLLRLKNSEKIDFLNPDLINQLNIINPNLSQMLVNMINLRNTYYVGTTSSKEVFDYMYMTLDIDYDNLLGVSPLKIDENLKPLARSLARDIMSGGSEDDISFLYDLPKKDLRDVLKSLKDGEYNPLVTNPYWFGEKLNVHTLSRWHIRRKSLEEKGISCGDVTILNYKVFAEIDLIINRINYINENGGAYISLNGHTQTPASEEEYKKIMLLLEEVLKRNYNWRESREVIKSSHRLSYHTDYNFPHNTDEIIKVFNPSVITYYDKYEDVDLKTDVSEIRKRAMEFYQEISANGLNNLFKSESQSSTDAYLKRMILSQFDITGLLRSNYGLYKEEMEHVCEELNSLGPLSSSTLEILFGNPRNEKVLLNLAKGTLLSLCKEDRIEDILNACIEAQKSLGCWQGIVNEMVINRLTLANDDVIYSLYCGDIKPVYNNHQRQYEFLLNSENDLEFVEGCTELFGDVIISQIFIDGNKRSARCLFNALLMSRGIVPPVTDLNQNERELFDKIAYGRFERYPEAKVQILQDSINTNVMMKENNYFYPVGVSMDFLKNKTSY